MPKREQVELVTKVIDMPLTFFLLFNLVFQINLKENPYFFLLFRVLVYQKFFGAAGKCSFFRPALERG